MLDNDQSNTADPRYSAALEDHARHDRVTELYRGEIFSVQAQAICRRRIDWIVSSLEGESILDVGCSQGIASILGAKRGKRVVGVDKSYLGIDFAHRERSNLPLFESRRISFLCADFLDLPPINLGRFECIILGNILEHIPAQNDLISNALALATDQAKLIITSVFGMGGKVNPNSAVTTSNLFELLEGRAAIQEIAIVDGIVRATAIVGAGSHRVDKSDLLSEVEQWSIKAHSEALANSRVLRDNSHLLRGRFKNLTERLGSYRTRLSHEREKCVKLEKSLEQIKLEATLEAASREATHKISEQRLIEALRAQSKTAAALRAELFLFQQYSFGFVQQFNNTVINGIKSPRGALTAPLGLTKLIASWAAIFAKRTLRKGLKIQVPYSRFEFSRKLLKLIHTGGVPLATNWALEAIAAGLIERKAGYEVLFDFLLSLAPHRALKLVPELIDNEEIQRKVGPTLAQEFNLARLLRKHELAEQLRAVLDRLTSAELSSEQLEIASQLRASRFIEDMFSVDEQGRLWSFTLAQSFREHAQVFVQEFGKAALQRNFDLLLRLGLPASSATSTAIFEASRELLPEQALAYGEIALKLSPSQKLLRDLSNLHHFRGNFSRALELAKLRDRFAGGAEVTQGPVLAIQSQLDLLHNGFPLPSKRAERKLSKDDGSEIRAAYLLHNSLPYTSNGYATRTHGLLSSLNTDDCTVTAYTRFGFPTDLKPWSHQAGEFPAADRIDNVDYIRLRAPRGGGFGKVPVVQYLNAYADSLHEHLLAAPVDLVHAASNFVNGVVGNMVARRLGVPSIYEVRGLWEVTRMSRQPNWMSTEYGQMQRRMETEAAQNADVVITITGALRDEMASRGIDRGKIQIVPNGVDSKRFSRLERDRELAAQLGIPDVPVIGYIGSIVDYEGLNVLLNASRVLRDSGIAFKVLIVGDGTALAALKAQCHDLQLEDTVIFTGRVPHHDVERHYSLTDICTFPRLGLPVCEMVSPIKPFEAMCMEKSVVVSSVAALAEMISDGETGLMFNKDDHLHLASVLKSVLLSRDLRERLGANARKWAARERDWAVLAKRVHSIYEGLTGSARARASR